MNWNEIKVVRLSEIVSTNLLYRPKMIDHPELGCLRKFAVRGKVLVEIFGYHDNDAGRLAFFKPLRMPGITRCALIQNFDLQPPPSKPSRALKELLSL